MYQFDTCLKNVGYNQNAFHKSSLDRNKGRTLMQRCKEFGTILFQEMKLCFEEARESQKSWLGNKPDTLGLATEKELKDKI